MTAIIRYVRPRQFQEELGNSDGPGGRFTAHVEGESEIFSVYTTMSKIYRVPVLGFVWTFRRRPIFNAITGTGALGGTTNTYWQANPHPPIKGEVSKQFLSTVGANTYELGHILWRSLKVRENIVEMCDWPSVLPSYPGARFRVSACTGAH